MQQRVDIPPYARSVDDPPKCRTQLSSALQLNTGKLPVSRAEAFLHHCYRFRFRQLRQILEQVEARKYPLGLDFFAEALPLRCRESFRHAKTVPQLLTRCKRAVQERYPFPSRVRPSVTTGADVGFAQAARWPDCTRSQPRDFSCRAPPSPGASASFFPVTRSRLFPRTGPEGTMITDRDIAVLAAIQCYYVLNRPQIQRLCFTDHSSGRATRRRLQELVSAGFLNRLRLVVHHPLAGSPGPVYYPARRGLELLAEHFDDERLLTTPTQPPQPHLVFHWLAVAETHIALDAAIALQNRVELCGWVNEFDTVNAEESAPEKRFRLYSLLREAPRLVCAPDAAFLLKTDGHTKVFYLEQDRNTSGVKRVAASKCQGYAVMAECGFHRRHFQQATVPAFTVLCIAPTERRRDALKKAFADKPGAGLWRFASATDFVAERLLFEPIYHRIDGEPVPLVRPIAADQDEQTPN
jgi:Replication-relaxation